MLYYYLSAMNANRAQKEIAIYTRRKKQSKLMRCFGTAVLFALCRACFLDSFALMKVQTEMTSYSQDEAIIPPRNKVRHSLSHTARSATADTTVQDWNVSIQPPPFSREESFAACILFLDQNHRITEWIAYHYFALPLRTLIIAYDPKTRERATKLMERWKNVISIVEWGDEDYLPANNTHAAFRRKPGQPIAEAAYVERQLLFVQKCHQRSVEMGVRKTIVLDLDEYFRINPEVIPSTAVNTSEPGHITKLFQQLEGPNNRLLTEQEGVTYKANCSVYPRVQYTTLGPNQWYTIPKDVEYLKTGLVDFFYYNTLRYRYRNLHRMKHPKSIINALDGMLHQRLINIHYPLDLECNKSAYTLDKSPFLFNHYIGSFEDFQYTFRNDFRNANLDHAEIRSKWEVRARGRGNDHAFDFHLQNPLVRDESITDWLPAFFAWQSDNVARVLLRDTGMRAVDLDH